MNIFFDIKAIKTQDKKYTLIDEFWFWWYGSCFYRYYQYSWLYELRWKITHWLRHDNWIKTNLPIGYYDKTSLMEDGLFSMISDYISVDGEDALNKIYLENN